LFQCRPPFTSQIASDPGEQPLHNTPKKRLRNCGAEAYSELPASGDDYCSKATRAHQREKTGNTRFRALLAAFYLPLHQLNPQDIYTFAKKNTRTIKVARKLAGKVKSKKANLVKSLS